jgi:hypothetical protein
MLIWDDFVRDSLMQRRWIIAGIIVTIVVIAAAALVKATTVAKKRESVKIEALCSRETREVPTQ